MHCNSINEFYHQLQTLQFDEKKPLLEFLQNNENWLYFKESQAPLKEFASRVRPLDHTLAEDLNQFAQSCEMTDRLWKEIHRDFNQQGCTKAQEAVDKATLLGENLTIADFSKLSLTNEQFKQLVAFCPNIRILILPNSKLSGDVLKELSKLEHLDTLDISRCSQVAPNSLQYFPKTLHKLKIAGCANLTGNPLKQCPQLVEVNLQGCKSLDMDTLNHTPKELETLNISGCHFSSLEPLKTVETLRILELSNCSKLTEEALEHLPKSLRELTVSSNPQLNLDPVLQLLQLHSLTLGLCPQLTSGFLSRLTPLTHLTTLNLVGCEQPLSSIPATLPLKQLRIRGCAQFSTDERKMWEGRGTKIIA